MPYLANVDTKQVNEFPARRKRSIGPRQLAPATFLAIFLFGACGGDGHAQGIVTGGYTLLNYLAIVNNLFFNVYNGPDAAGNHGFPSGYEGNSPPNVNLGCIDDPAAMDGCATDPGSMSLTGNVLSVTFSPLHSGQWGGFYFEEPQYYLGGAKGNGYNLAGTSQILFSARSPTGISVQFGVNGATTQYEKFPASNFYTSVCIALQNNANQVCPKSAQIKLNLQAGSLSAVHLLFGVEANNTNAPNGGVILIGPIGYAPVPQAYQGIATLPLSTITLGIIPAETQQSPPITVPPDQVNRNVASIYESALTVLALFARGQANDKSNAYYIAYSLAYALYSPNQGDPIPPAPPPNSGLHDAYEAGTLPLFNSQGNGGGLAGQDRLAGFSANYCGNSGYCLVLDGATGGNNAFAMLAMLKALKESGNQGYLTAAVTIGNWIYAQLLDPSGTGFGGYYDGYDHGGLENTLNKGKSTENNADIFAAFSGVAAAYAALGDKPDETLWSNRATIAGDFVINMFNTASGCFYAGTVPVGTLPGPGVNPTGPTRGNDVINVFNFLDANSFSYLALAPSPQFGHAIAWSRVPACLAQFSATVQAGGTAYSGYDLVTTPISGPNGIAWEFTGQAAVVTELSGGNATSIVNNLSQAQANAPFNDGLGIVAATLQGQNTSYPYTPPPYQQCLSTPFQCIPERIGIAATAWGIFAETGYDPFF
jgi:hypothetical protein